MKNLGCVQVQILNLLEKDTIHPGSKVNLNLDITNSSKVTFDQVQISVREVQSWSSLIQPKTGNSPTMMETTKLSKEKICNWDIIPIVDESTGKKQRFVQLHDLSIDVPKSASNDRPYGLLRIHHYLQIKLTSDGAIINNLRFRFPLVLGGEQHEIMSDDHPLHKIKRGNKSLSKTLAFGIARTVIVASKAAEFLFDKPIGAVKQGAARKDRPALSRRTQHESVGTIVSVDDASDRQAAINQ